MRAVGRMRLFQTLFCWSMFATCTSSVFAQNLKDLSADLTPYPSSLSFLEKRNWAWQFLDQILSEAHVHLTSQDLSQTFSQNYSQFSYDERHGLSFVNWNKVEVSKTATLLENIKSPLRTFYSASSGQHILSRFYPLTECLKYVSVNTQSRAYCLGQEFPMGAYIIKLAWTRLDNAQGILVPDTSNSALQDLEKHFFEWQKFSPTEQTSPFIVQVSPQESYALVGIHIMSKSVPDWVWVSAWWSPQEDSNFAEDRPVQLKSSWLRQAKLCMVDDFKMESSFEGAGFHSLKKAMTILNIYTKGHSWCSNPYIEHGKGNARSNCIGCHQYAGTEANSSEILKDSLVDPLKILSQNNTKVPLDYSWSLIQGERALGLELVDWRDYFETKWGILKIHH